MAATPTSARTTRRTASSRQSPASHVVASAAATGDVQGEKLDSPSVANKNWVRVAAIAATVAAAARGTAYLPQAGMAFVHLLAYSTWLGALVWTTFIAGIVTFKNLPRQTFGRLQSKLFPMCALQPQGAWGATHPFLGFWVFCRVYPK